MVRCEPFAGLTSQLNRRKLLFFHQLGMNINVEAYWNQNRKTKNELVIAHLSPPLVSPFPKNKDFSIERTIPEILHSCIFLNLKQN